MFKTSAELFVCGAAGYCAIETLWRGHTHWTMALAGGSVLVGLRHLRRALRFHTGPERCIAGALLITTAEYVVGLTVNRHYHMQVWDYSGMKGNLQGQICPQYAIAWLLLSGAVMLPRFRSLQQKKNHV